MHKAAMCETYPQFVCILVDEGTFFVVCSSVFPKILNLCDEGFPSLKFIVRNRLLNVFQGNGMRDLSIVVGIVSFGRLLVEFEGYFEVRITAPGKLSQA